MPNQNMPNQNFDPNNQPRSDFPQNNNQIPQNIQTDQVHQPTISENFGSNQDIQTEGTNSQNPSLNSNLDPNLSMEVQKEKNFYERQKAKYYNFEVQFFTQFLTFLKQFGIVALALGVVIGQTTNKLVNSMVENIITPLINLLLPGNATQNFESLDFFGIKYGAFISSLIEFVLVLFIIFLVVNFVISRLLTSEEKQKLNMESKENE